MKSTELRYEQGGETQTMRFTEPAPFRVSVNALQGNEILVAGHSSSRPSTSNVPAACARWRCRSSLELGTLMRYDPAAQSPYLEEADTGEEILVFGDPDLDLSDYLAETTLLDTPLSVLHDEACRGLCQVCGHDLNEGPCEHRRQVPSRTTPSAFCRPSTREAACPAKSFPALSTWSCRTNEARALQRRAGADAFQWPAAAHGGRDRKTATHREATAEAWVILPPAARAALESGTNKKGDPLTVARLAGLAGSKRTSDLIMLCHPIPVTGAQVEVSLKAARRAYRGDCENQAPTGVEMEALTAVTVAALNVYDMLKAASKAIRDSGRAPDGQERRQKRRLPCARSRGD